jgi:poly(3-hydroxybutyrate) depolymerase
MRGEAKKIDGGRADARVMPTIVFHGDQDATVHPCNGTHVISRASADASLQTTVERKTTAAGDSYSHTVRYDARGDGILELWEVHGAGHAWSGGSPKGSFTAPSGPDATQEMLRFFLEHRQSAN